MVCVDILLSYSDIESDKFAAGIMAVRYNLFLQVGIDITAYANEASVFGVFDCKGLSGPSNVREGAERAISFPRDVNIMPKLFKLSSNFDWPQ